MALGVLEPRGSEAEVPGTVYVSDDSRQVAHDVHLKRDKSGQFILVPQPSDDPNDPLNWPLWKRDLILGILSFVSVVAATTSPLLAANTITLAFDFKRTFQASALLTGYHLCGVGVGGIIFVPFARIYGKRFPFLFGCLLMIASSAWGGSTIHNHNFASLTWARVVQGVALAPFEALVNAVVGDMYFVHQRGKRMAVTNVALFGGAFLTPVFVGIITHDLGWQWSFYFVAIFMAVGFLLVFFFVPETAYKRAGYLNTDMEQDATSKETLSSTPPGSGGDEPSAASGGKTKESYMTTMSSTQEGSGGEGTRAAEGGTAKLPYTKTLMPFNGRKVDESFFKLFLRPFPLFVHPGIAWACLTQGVIIAWTVFVGVIIAAVFFGPPLFFDEEQTGYMYVGAFIGSVVGLLLAGLLSDSSTKFMIRKNHGKYEPEFRILLVFPMLIFSCIGLYGFGITAANVTKYGWLIPEVFLAFIIISMVLGAVGSALYIVDAHRQIAVESFTCLMIFKNIFAFVITYNAYNWTFAGGIRPIFIAIASVQVGICALSVPMYILGKKNRAFFARHDLFALTRLK